MSSRRRNWWAGVVAAVSLLAEAPGARAQTQAEYRERIRALVPVWHEMATLKRREDSIAALAVPNDTVRDGPLVVLVDPVLAPFARQVVAASSARLVQRFGRAADMLATHPYVLGSPDSGPTARSPISLSELDGARQVRFVQSEPPELNAVVYAVTHRAASAIGAPLGSGFNHWLGGTLPADSATAAMWTGVRIDLVTSSFAMARACYAGADSACALALGVVGGDDPAVRWFDAAERREYVHRLSYRFRSDDRASYTACVTHKVDTACTALLQQIPVEDIGPPLSPAARQGLAILALDLGGPEAVTRILAAPNERASQLAAAAGIPVDSLVRLWRRATLAARSSNPSMSWSMALTSLLWITACAALALRSSPWR